MKILVVGPQYFNYPDSATWALEQLGHNVVQYNWTEFGIDKSYWIRKLNKFSIKNFEENHKINWGLSVVNLCKNFKPDLCLVMNGDWISETVLDSIQNKGCRIILWMIDGISRMPRNEEKLSYYHQIFSFDHTDSLYLKNKYGIDCEYCQVGYDPRYYFPKESVHRDIDISFVGHGIAHRKTLLQNVANFIDERGLSFAIYGNYWDSRYFWKKMKFARRHPILQKYIHNKSVHPMEVANIYRRSKICLNIHIPDHNGINPRTFEILGAKSFQLIDQHPMLNEFLTEGSHLVAYNDSQDILVKIDHFLSASREREAIATEGHYYALERYSITRSMQKIMFGK